MRASRRRRVEGPVAAHGSLSYCGKVDHCWDEDFWVEAGRVSWPAISEGAAQAEGMYEVHQGYGREAGRREVELGHAVQAFGNVGSVMGVGVDGSAARERAVEEHEVVSTVWN